MESKKTNWFVRGLIIALCLFIGVLIHFNFFRTCPPAQISIELLFLVAFLTVLVLSESFDNFSIFKLISLSRTINEKEKLNSELKIENSELRNQIISISTNISQKQYNSTFVLTDELAKMLSVRQADEPEKQQKQKEIEQETANDTQKTQESTARKYVSGAKYEEIALPKFLAMVGMSQLPIVRDAKFTNQFQQIDPVSEFSPIFDGYIKTIDTEIFIEMKISNRSVILRDRLYLMLSKINYYKTIKRVNAYLFLVLINRPDIEQSPSTIDRLKKEFEPAVTNGLLKIQEVEITEQENQQILND